MSQPEKPAAGAPGEPLDHLIAKWRERARRARPLEAAPLSAEKRAGIAEWMHYTNCANELEAALRAAGAARPQPDFVAIRERLAERRKPPLGTCHSCGHKQEMPPLFQPIASALAIEQGKCANCGGVLCFTFTIGGPRAPSPDEDIAELLVAGDARPLMLVDLRAAWEAGFRLCRSYADNHAHFDGEQKERQWQAYLKRTPEIGAAGAVRPQPLDSGLETAERFAKYLAEIREAVDPSRVLTFDELPARVCAKLAAGDARRPQLQTENHEEKDLDPRGPGERLVERTGSTATISMGDE